MRKLTKVVSVVAAVVIMGNMMSVVQANPTPPVAEPDKIVSLGANNTVTSGPNRWGHDTAYDLKVIDKNGDLYSLGKPYEVFGNVTFSTDTAIKGAFQAAGAPGPPSGPKKPWPEGANFTDHNVAYLSFDTGTDTFWYLFRQTWHVIRVSDGLGFPLNTQTVAHYQNYAFRTD